jgi:hypothetical protein
MAPTAFVRRSGVFVLRTVDMALGAFGNGVDAGQRKTVLGMLVENVAAILPALGCVTVLAAGSELVAMHIVMAIDARLGSLSEIEVRVTLGALHGTMDPLEGKAGLVVIELQAVLQRGP